MCVYIYKGYVYMYVYIRTRTHAHAHAHAHTHKVLLTMARKSLPCRRALYAQEAVETCMHAVLASLHVRNS